MECDPETPAADSRAAKCCVTEQARAQVFRSRDCQARRRLVSELALGMFEALSRLKYRGWRAWAGRLGRQGELRARQSGEACER